MDHNDRDSQATEKKLSDQFVEFIDLTDEDLEEVDILELGDIHGGQCNCNCMCMCNCNCNCMCMCNCNCDCRGE